MSDDFLIDVDAEEPNNDVVITEAEIEEATKNSNIVPIRPVDMKGYKSLSLEEMVVDVPRAIEYVFYPCMPTQGICWVYAAAGVGKTMFTLNLAYAIGSGGRFLNYTCPRPRRVLYVDGEMAYNQLHARVMTIRKQQGEMDFPNYLHFLTPDKMQPVRVPKIDEPEGQYIYEKKMVEEGFEVIVFDHCSALSSIDMNKGVEWKNVNDWQLKLRALGKSIINVHHAGKDPTVYRGASDMMDAADAAICLQPINENELEAEIISTKKLKVKYTKNRNFGGQEALPFEVTFNDGIWTCRSLEKSDMERIVDLVKLKMNQRDISKDTGISLGKVNRLIREAKKVHLLRED